MYCAVLGQLAPSHSLYSPIGAVLATAPRQEHALRAMHSFCLQHGPGCASAVPAVPSWVHCHCLVTAIHYHCLVTVIHCHSHVSWHTVHHEARVAACHWLPGAGVHKTRLSMWAVIWGSLGSGPGKVAARRHAA